MLASLAHSSESSFVFRGKFTRKQLLCRTGDAAAEAQQTFNTIPLPPNPTGKDISAAVVARAECSGCHAPDEPAGLSFEQFDALGQWRTTYASGKLIDPTGVLPQVGGGPGWPGTTCLLRPDLDDGAARERTPGCAPASTQVFGFTVSRMDTPADVCAIRPSAMRSSRLGRHAGRGILAITATDAFTHRSDQ